MIKACLYGRTVGWTLNRQTTLPPVSEGRASGAALRAPSPPSARSVCLIFSSCPGSLTTMTGSELAGHRLLESARHVVLRTALLARRGGAGPPLKRPPPPALRAPPAPSGGGQSVAIGPGRRDRRVSLRPVYGIYGPLHYRANLEIAVTPRGHAERGEGIRDTRRQIAGHSPFRTTF